MNINFSQAFNYAVALQGHVIGDFFLHAIHRLSPRTLNKGDQQQLEQRTNAIAQNFGINKPIAIVDSQNRANMESFGNASLPFKLSVSANSYQAGSDEVLTYQVVQLKFNHNLKNYIVTTLAATATLAGTYFYFKRPLFLVAAFVGSVARLLHHFYQRSQAKALSIYACSAPSAEVHAFFANKSGFFTPSVPRPQAPAPALKVVEITAPKIEAAPVPVAPVPAAAPSTVLPVVFKEPSAEEIAEWSARLDAAKSVQRTAVFNFNRSPNTKKGKNKKERLGNQIAALEKEIKELQKQLARKA